MRRTARSAQEYREKSGSSNHKVSYCGVTGKVRFHSLGGAEQALLKIQERQSDQACRIVLRSYHCHYCGGYHHTSKRLS